MKKKALRAGVAHSHENYGGFSGQNVKKGRKENGTENVDCIWTCSQKSAASKSQDDVFGSTGADFIGSAVYQQSIDRKYENLY